MKNAMMVINYQGMDVNPVVSSPDENVPNKSLVNVVAQTVPHMDDDIVRKIFSVPAVED